MTQVTNDDVRHLAQLSSLQLSDGDIDSLRTDLSDILGYVEQLRELDTSNVTPTYQVTDLENIWRDDIVQTNGADREELLGLASDIRDHQIKVPKVL